MTLDDFQKQSLVRTTVPPTLRYHILAEIMRKASADAKKEIGERLIDDASTLDDDKLTKSCCQLIWAASVLLGTLDKDAEEEIGKYIENMERSLA